jgi:hypothetical protein
MFKSRVVPLVFTVIVGLACFARPAWAAPFTIGDVFASVSNGMVIEFTPTGTAVQTLNTGQGGFTTGSAFDSTGKLYLTNFSASSVSVFSNNGVLQGTFGSGYSTPESIVFDAAGNVYVGNLGNGLREYDSTGALLQSFNTGRVDWFDLTPGATGALYTQENDTITRFNLTTNTSAGTFASSPGADFALRILPDGTVLAADSSVIRRFNAAGTQIQTYDTGSNNAWFALNLDPDGTTFWSGDFGTANVCRFNIATGALVNCFNTGTGSGTLFGLSVFGEITVVNPPPTGVPEPTTMALFAAGALGFIGRHRRLGKK